MGIANFGEAQRAGYLKLMALKATHRKTGESPVKKCLKKSFIKRPQFWKLVKTVLWYLTLEVNVLFPKNIWLYLHVMPLNSLLEDNKSWL